MGKKRKQVDWDRIETAYRLGQKSMRTLADEFKVNVSNISRRAKKYKWVQDKSEEVRQRTNAALVAQRERNTPTKEDVEISVQTNIKVILDHRASIQNGRRLAELLFAQLDKAAGNREELEAEIENETKEDQGVRRRNFMLRAVSLPSHAGILRDLSIVLKSIIPLERQAFNLDESEKQPGPLDPDEAITDDEQKALKLGFKFAIKKMAANAAVSETG